MSRTEAPRPTRGFGMGGVYRVSRMLHAYLSAFAFLALIFFSVTGILLNHPDWLSGEEAPETVRMVSVPRGEIEAALRAPDREAALAAAVRARAPVLGGYRSGEVIDTEALLQFSGPKGGTEVALALDSGAAEVTVRPARTVTFLNDLHTGKDSGAVWKAVIDVSAVFFILLSLIGYVLFFSLRFRLKTSLALTAASLVLLAALAWLLVA